MLRGSCLCQGVAFEIDGTVLDLLYCHCSMCRKAHGSAFRARGKVKTSEFRWVRGEEMVRYYESSPGQHRGFCSICGSNLVSKFAEKPRVLGLALGVLDDDPVNRPLCHVFVGNKAPWHEITDSLPQFEQLPTQPATPKDGMHKRLRLWCTPHVKRGATWLSVLLLLLVCVSIFRGWLAPENVASWLLLLSFCS